MQLQSIEQGTCTAWRTQDRSQWSCMRAGRGRACTLACRARVQGDRQRQSQEGKGACAPLALQFTVFTPTDCTVAASTLVRSSLTSMHASSQMQLIPSLQAAQPHLLHHAPCNDNDARSILDRRQAVRYDQGRHAAHHSVKGLLYAHKKPCIN